MDRFLQTQACLDRQPTTGCPSDGLHAQRCAKRKFREGFPRCVLPSRSNVPSPRANFQLTTQWVLSCLICRKERNMQSRCLENLRILIAQRFCMVTVQSPCTRILNILIDTPFCWDVGQHRRRWPLWAVTGHGNDSAKQISISIELPSWKIDRKSNFCG